IRSEDLNHFLSIIHEIANNDLKYGTGASSWKIQMDGNSMTVSFEAETVREEDRARSGKGQSTIKRRAAIIHSEFKHETVSGRYRAELIIPVADLFS
ncbi:MAG TPA: hypothetical protein PL048_17985, partial [Leptospiraceae bacterium]|nr:hypothetical protein [Leptospiraceae bacterium]